MKGAGIVFKIQLRVIERHGDRMLCAALPFQPELWRRIFTHRRLPKEKEESGGVAKEVPRRVVGGGTL